MEDRWAVKMADCVMNKKLPEYTADETDAKVKVDMLIILRAFIILYRGSSDRRYLQFCKDYITRLVNRNYSIKGLDLKAYRLTGYSIGKPLLDLYRETNDIRFKRAAGLIYAKLKKQPKNTEGALIYGDGSITVKADGIYCAVPFYTECVRSIDSKMMYGNVINQFLAYSRDLKDEKTGLFYQNYDSSKKAQWADTQSGKSKSLWICSTGFYAMALADCLDCIGERVYDRKHLRDIAEKLCEAVFNVQDDKSGCWYFIMDCGERKGNYLESSGSCMLLYFLCVCFRLRIISGQKAIRAINSAHDGIIDEFIEITQKGGININKCSSFIEIIDKTDKDGSYAHYISEPVLSNELRAMGAFILAMNEYSRIRYILKKQIYTD